MWVSEREKREAKQYDAYSYLRIADPSELMRLSSNEYCLRSHDSFKISQKNGVWLWYWYSRNFGGRSAIDYLIKVKGYSFVDAVKEVNRVMKGMSPSFFIEEKEEKKFKLPPKNSNSEHVVRYLCSRGIDKHIVQELVDVNMIFQNKKYLSVVFVGVDDNGKPAHAAYRSTGDGSAVKGDYTGSNKEYAFRIERDKAETVRVFESAIDLLSYMTLCKIWRKDCSTESLISTAGISASRTDEIKLPLALSRYLEKHPETETILLHFDNDAAGRKCAEQIKYKLRNDFRVKSIMPKRGKDYNEYLQIVRCFGEKEHDSFCR